jgi:hypothetical protein
MNKHAGINRWMIRAALVAALQAGCDDRPSPAPTPVTGPAAGTRPAATAPDPGPPGRVTPFFAKGRVLGEDGKPISIAGARITVLIRGVTRESSDVEEHEIFPGSDGYYSKQLSPGHYFPLAGRVEMNFNGRQYRFSLDPTQPKADGWEASQGMLQDFTWKLSGVRPGMRPDKSQMDAWYGGSIVATYHGFREDLGRSIPPAPKGTTVVFTLTPQGPLVDGRPGKVMTFGPFDEEALIGDLHFTDIPLAKYLLIGEEVYTNGPRERLVFEAEGRWVDGLAGTFAPDLANSTIWPIGAPFSRPTPVVP